MNVHRFCWVRSGSSLGPKILNKLELLASEKSVGDLTGLHWRCTARPFTKKTGESTLYERKQEQIVRAFDFKCGIAKPFVERDMEGSATHLT